MNERRSANRVPMKVRCVVSVGGRDLTVWLLNLSDDGALLRVEKADGRPISEEDLGQETSFVLSSFSPPRRYTGEIIRSYFHQGAHHLALRFWERYTEVNQA